MNQKLIQIGVLNILQGLGCDIKHPDFKQTPERVYRMYKEILNGPRFRWSRFPCQGYNEMVVHVGHHCFGFCPHHLLPIEMRISVAYIPTARGYVPGLSKVPRLASKAAGRLVLQEQVGVDIVDTLMKSLKLNGAGCFILGRHMCMSMRGIKTDGIVATSALRGVFLEKPEVRQEFFSLVREGQQWKL